MTALVLPPALIQGRYTKPSHLFALVAVVVLVHGVLLQYASQALRSGHQVFNKPLVLRTVQLATADPAVPLSPPSAAPAPVAQPKPRPPKPAPVDAPASPTPTPGGTVGVMDIQPSPAEPPPRYLTTEELDAISERSARQELLQQAAAAAAAASAAQASSSEPTAAPAAVGKVAFSVPGSVRLKFNAMAKRPGVANPYYGFGEILWQHDGTAYLAQIDAGVSIFGLRRKLRSVKSSGKLTVDGLRPDRFSDHAGTEVAAHFERDKGKVVFSANTPSADLHEGQQDQATIFLQIAAMLSGDSKRYPLGTVLVFEVVGPRSLETWQFTIGNLETLQLPGGEVQALKLDKAPSHAFDSRVEIWLAPAQGYFPVRIQSFERNGDVIDLQWSGSEPP